MDAPPLDLFPVDDRGSVVWLDPADPVSRSSAAIVVGGGTLLVDPVDSPAVDGLLSGLPSVVGVATLLGRHQRDAEAIALRLAVPRLLPRALGGPGIGLPGVEERTVIDRGGWHEALLWLADRRLLVCVEAVGTARFFLGRRGEALGMHPVARLRPPRAAFAGLDPAAIVVGHGPPVTDRAGESLGRALSRARRDLPVNWARLVTEVVRARRAARRARR
jgi:hypothetical protein